LADRLPVDRVVQAAKTLTDLRLGRRDGGTIVKWMAIKSAGVTSTDWGEVTSADVVRFCDDYFAVPGREPHNWYDPFASAWWQNAGNGGWPIGTIWTQIDRANAKLRAAVSLERQTTPSGSIAYRVKTATGAVYREALEAIIGPEKRVPALDLAVWRYRFGIPEGTTDARSLVDAMVAELYLTEEERAIVLREDLVP